MPKACHHVCDRNCLTCDKLCRRKDNFYSFTSEPVSIRLPSGAAMQQVRWPHGSVMGGMTGTAPFPSFIHDTMTNQIYVYVILSLQRFLYFFKNSFSRIILFIYRTVCRIFKNMDFFARSFQSLIMLLLRPALNSRLYVRMQNGEEVLVSRKYAHVLKEMIA